MSQNTKDITVADPKAAITEWYAKLSQYCASVDYDSTQAIFADDVLSFGTRADIVSGLGPLQKNQWEGIWPNIQNFQINMDSIHYGGDAENAWGIATWTSTGFHEDGTSFHRPGRATVILERRDGKWLSVHTHFSLNPGTPPRTYGRKS
ncbi:MAG: YybH family protein [Dehalococcoidia bacterium]